MSDSFGRPLNFIIHQRERLKERNRRKRKKWIKYAVWMTRDNHLSSLHPSATKELDSSLEIMLLIFFTSHPAKRKEGGGKEKKGKKGRKKKRMDA